MQTLLDAIKLQKQRGYNHNRTVIGTIENPAKALQEATEMIRCIISECLDRNLPIDDALAKQHFCEMAGNGNNINYQEIIDIANNQKVFAMRQTRSASSVNLLQKIQAAYNQK